MLAAGTVTGALAGRLGSIRLALRDAGDITAAAQVAAQSWPSPSRTGERAWKRASAEAMLLIRVCARLDDPVRAIKQRVQAARAESFTEIDAGDTAPVQVMNLHQTKGRKADAVIIAFRSGDYHGPEGEPFPAASRLLYVVLTRARKQITLIMPTDPHPLVALSPASPPRNTPPAKPSKTLCDDGQLRWRPLRRRPRCRVALSAVGSSGPVPRSPTPRAGRASCCPLASGGWFLALSH
jgi:hypothetical protein